MDDKGDRAAQGRNRLILFIFFIGYQNLVLSNENYHCSAGSQSSEGRSSPNKCRIDSHALAEPLYYRSITKTIKGGNKSKDEVIIMVEMLVRDAISESYVKLSPKTISSEAAKVMADSDADCILVVIDEKPVGIVTASDFLRRIVAEGINASEIPLKKIMSSPVITIDSEETLSEALIKLSSSGVKRLVVSEGDAVQGIVTSVELLSYADELGAEEEREVGPSMCEICGGYFEVLSEVDGKFVCEDCEEMLEG